MAYPANEGGISGKFRRRPSARTPSKPYDRPPTALRGVRGGGQVTGERGGWMSKLLDPASRLITNGAAKLFASMFRKRLTAPPLEPGSPDKDHLAADIPQRPSTNSLSETRNGEMHNGGSSVNNQKYSSDCGIVELEQLLKQKTFTMVEFNHLEELLRSRTVESSDANHENSNDKKGKSVVLASDDVPGSSKIHKKFPSNGLASQSQTPMIEARSPAEVAKAYMGSRPSKDFSLSGSLRDQVSNEETNLKSMASAPRRLDLSVAPRSVIRFSGIPEQHQYQNYAYQTTKPVGRSAMYRMSRSPYFQVNRAASTQVGEISRDDHSSPVSSQWKSRGKQALKRGITALDDEHGSYGPIRRIRQKSNLVSPSRINNSTTSMQKSLYLEGRKHGSTSSETAEGGTEKNSIMLPMQSSEKAHKLFQQLDKLLPSSPKEKPSELKAMTIDDSPSKLTFDMLHGSALKSMENIRSSNFLSTQEVGKAAIASSEQYVVNCPSKSKNMDEESSLPKNHAFYGMDLKAPQANGVSKTTVPSKNVTKPAPLTQKKSASNSVSIPISKRPAFRISAPEDSFDLDDDEDDNTNHLSIPSTSTPPDSVTKISAQNGSFSKTSAENPISGSMFCRKDEKKDAIHPVFSKKENEFTFPIASDTSTQSQLPPTPTILTPQLNTQDPQKEAEKNPIPSSGSKDFKPSTDDAGIKVGEEFRSEATLTTSSTSTYSVNESTMVKSEAPKTGDVHKSPTAASETSTTSIPALFSFGASSTSSLSNGSLNPSPNMDSVPSKSIFGNNNPTNSVSNISSVSSAAATFSTTAPTPSLQQSDTPKSNNTEANTFKASSFSMPASTSQDTSSVLPTSSPSMSNSTTSTSAATSSAFSSTPSSAFGFSTPTQSIGSSVFGATNGSTTTSTLSASSSQNSKPIVSGATEISSQNSTAVAFGANSTVTFGADNNNSSQKSSMNTFGVSSTTSQKPDAITFGFGATDDNPQKPSAITFGAENNNSRNSKITTFGATDNKPATVNFGSANGSVFGTQSTQTVTESAQASQSSTSQFGLFSSSPSFGLSNSSSGSFGNSPFGSTSSNLNPFTSSIFGSSSQASSASPIFTSNSSSSSNTSASAPLFGSSTSSSSPFQFGSSNSGSGFTFGSSASVSTSTPTPFTFNSSSTSSTSSFTFNSSSTSSTTSFAFNSSSTKPTFGFGANSPNNDQMSVEDSMTDAANQPLTPTFPTFGQPQNPTTTTPGFMFGSPAPPQQNAVPSFSFGGVQNPPAQQNASPFQPGGGVDFNPGGSFSLGSGGGGDKSARKIIKVKRGLRGRK